MRRAREVIIAKAEGKMFECPLAYLLFVQYLQG
jgi:hypothetical protein